MRRALSRGSLSQADSALASALVIAAFAMMRCSGARATAETETAPDRPALEAPRPPGLAIDPVLVLPGAAGVAEPVAGIAVLAEPVDPEPARRVVRAFFEAVISESPAELDRTLDRGARTRPNSRTRAEAALPWWHRRFDRLDYTALGSEVFYRRSDIEAHTARDTATVAPSRPLPSIPRGDDVVVRVPVVGRAAEKLFGPELVFLLKKGSKPPHPARDSAPGAAPPGAPGSSEYKIAELFEDFRLP